MESHNLVFRSLGTTTYHHLGHTPGIGGSESFEEALGREAGEQVAKDADKARKERAEVAKADAASATTPNKSRVFMYDWADAGHPRPKTFVGLTSLAKGLTDNDPYSDPILLSSVDMDLEWKNLARVLSSWPSSFHEHCQKKKLTSAQHALQAAQGVAEFQPLVNKILDADLMASDCIAKDMHAQTFLFGYTASHLGFDLEPNCLGCLRYVHSGSMGALLIPVGSLASGLAKLNGSQSVTMNEILDWGRDLDDRVPDTGALAKLAEVGVRVTQLRVTAGQILVVPPGYIFACVALGAEGVAGVRRAFLPKGNAALQNLKAVLSAFGDKKGDQIDNLRKIVECLEVQQAIEETT